MQVTRHKSQVTKRHDAHCDLCLLTCDLYLDQLDHMERPTSALHLTRVTLSLRQLGAEPHTKEVGRDEVYNHHCLRSARGHDGRGGVVAGAPDAGAAYAGV